MCKELFTIICTFRDQLFTKITIHLQIGYTPKQIIHLLTRIAHFRYNIQIRNDGYSKTLKTETFHIFLFHYKNVENTNLHRKYHNYQNLPRKSKRGVFFSPNPHPGFPMYYQRSEYLKPIAQNKTFEFTQFSIFGLQFYPYKYYIHPYFFMRNCMRSKTTTIRIIYFFFSLAILKFSNNDHFERV